MKTAGILGVCTSLATVAATSFAATDTSNVHIVETRIAIGTPSVGVIAMDGAAASGSVPACATYNASGRWLTVDIGTDGGREVMKIAVAAQLSGKLVRITGSGTCIGNKESVASIYMLN